ncbi:MAG: hypothetical protein JOZ52_05600 [Acidobacteria bacterium]|nr:hypothetical protein [Acidobacteriota bacterium]
MMEKKSKYDTNPLDPDFPRKTQEVSGATEGVSREGEERTRTLESEAPTRRIEAPYSAPTSYPSVFIPPQRQPPVAQGVPFAPPSQIQPPTSRVVPGINLPENVVLIVPYLPFYLGTIAAVVELYLVPRTETRARFHAAQGLALHLAIIAIQFLFFTLRSFTGGVIGSWLFSFAAFAFLIISVIRVWKGEPHHITPLDDATKWLNEKIEPRK